MTVKTKIRVYFWTPIALAVSYFCLSTFYYYYENIFWMTVVDEILLILALLSFPILWPLGLYAFAKNRGWLTYNKKIKILLIVVPLIMLLVTSIGYYVTKFMFTTVALIASVPADGVAEPFRLPSFSENPFVVIVYYLMIIFKPARTVALLYTIIGIPVGIMLSIIRKSPPHPSQSTL